MKKNAKTEQFRPIHEILMECLAAAQDDQSALFTHEANEIRMLAQVCADYGIDRVEDLEHTISLLSSYEDGENIF